MATVPGVEDVSRFIKLAGDLKEFGEWATPDYQNAALGMYKICHALLNANEKLTEWFHRFLYFDFKSNGAVARWNELAQEYKQMKQGRGYRAWKFSCGDLSPIYYQTIEHKLSRIFYVLKKDDGLKKVFEALTDADTRLVKFIEEDVLKRLDGFVRRVDQLVLEHKLVEAERERLKFRQDNHELLDKLSTFGNELTDLVIEFANVAGVPITLGDPTE